MNIKTLIAAILISLLAPVVCHAQAGWVLWDYSVYRTANRKEIVKPISSTETVEQCRELARKEVSRAIKSWQDNPGFLGRGAMVDGFSVKLTDGQAFYQFVCWPAGIYPPKWNELPN